MNLAVTAVETLAFVAFTCALGTFVSIPTSRESDLSASGKLLMVVAMAVYVFVALSNVLEHSGASVTLDAAEDYVEMMFPTFVAYAVHTISARQRENDLVQAYRALETSHTFVTDIVDATPAGIVVLDQRGWIIFANEAARECLDLLEDHAVPGQPGWVVRDDRYADSEPKPDFGGFIGDKPVRQAPVTVEWPNGWRRRLLLNVVPMSGSRGLGGAIAAFVDRPAGPESGR